MYKYSISANTWSTVSVTAARAAQPVAGMGADWVGVTGNAKWADITNIQDGRYIYSTRGTGVIIDRFDITTGAWLPTTGVPYVNTLITFNNGSSTFWDNEFIYIMKEGTAAIPVRFYKFNIVNNYLETFQDDWMFGGAAVVGNKMWIKDLPAGCYAKREWYQNRDSLCIGNINGVLMYFKKGIKQEEARTRSSAYQYNDFVPCTREAKPIKEFEMDYEDINYIVTTNYNGVKGFKTEETALSYIQEEFETDGKLKFKMFKAYQKIEPKRPVLTDFITTIIG